MSVPDRWAGIVARVGLKAKADLVLGLLAETPDITVEKLRAALATRGHTFG